MGPLEPAVECRRSPSNHRRRATRKNRVADPDRWQHVERLFHAALARDESERAAFLREACGGDEPLRREVESLLTFESDAQAFMQASALEIAPAADRIRRRRHRWSASVLGRTRLARSSAPAGWATSTARAIRSSGATWRSRFCRTSSRRMPDRRARFEREARLLAALNHPHIGAIYGFEERDGIHGLVLELVEGQTLAERLRAGPLPIPEALTIARQIAEALEAAHEKGIVHRDLKPANIVLQGVTWPYTCGGGLHTLGGPSSAAVGRRLSIAGAGRRQCEGARLRAGEGERRGISPFEQASAQARSGRATA